MKKIGLLWFLGPVLGASACFFDPAVPADGAQLPQIDCAEAADCPPDWLCNPTLGRCVPVSRIDSTAPALAGTPLLTPAVGGLGQAFSLSFEVSEALSLDPVVWLDIGGGRQASAVLDESATDRAALRYGYTYTATGSELEGTRLVTLDLTDRSGNVARNLAAGSLVLDFTRPRVVAAVLSPLVARAGVEVSLHLELSELLPSPPTLELVHGDGAVLAFAHQGSSGTLGHAYRYVATGSEAEGAYTARASGADAAGNLLDEPQVAKVVLDFTAPTTGSTRIDPAVAMAGQRVLVDVDLGEELASWGALVAVPLASGATTHAYTELSRSSARLRFEHTVAAGSDGRYQLELRELVDQAGNATASVLVGSVEYDTSPPAVRNLSTDAQVYSAQAGHGLITASFDVDEALAGGRLEVWLGSEPFACGPRQAATPSYTCHYAVTGSEPEGLALVATRVTDAAGNSGVASVPVRLDFTPPGVVEGTAELVLAPAAGCPLTTVTRWTVGATARVLLVLDEPAGSIPTVATVSTVAPEALTFAHRSGAVTSFAYARTLQAGEATVQGLYRLVAQVVDAVGNRATRSLEPTLPLLVDTAPPLAPDVDAEAGIVYARAPWGLDEDRSGALSPPLFRITAGAAVVDPDTTWVVAFDGPDPGAASVIGRSLAAAGSFEPMTLNRADRSDVHLIAYDDACNPSPARRVRAVSWTASMGRKVPDSTLANPHVLGRAPRMLSSLRQGEPWAELDAAELPAVLARDGLASRSATGAYWSEQLYAGALPAAISGYGMAYDSARGRAVLFGVYGTTADTWEWDGTRWTKREPLGAVPEARYGHGMAYDSARDRTVLFGGYHTSTRWNDTWEWDGTRWSQRATSGNRPSARSGPGMAYDSARGVVVLFGGDDLNFDQQNDTWEWDGIAWTRPPTSGRIPIPRENPAMAYDSSRKVVVLIGGYSDSAGTLEDVWEWDGTAWSEVVPIGQKPPLRSMGAMAYDSVRRVMVIFGGFAGTSTRLNDTWEWNGASWTPGEPTGAVPRARTGQVMAYDSVRGRVLMFGGNGSGAAGLNDTWEWDGSAWSDRTSTGQIPAARYLFAMAYDGARQRAVVFGGSQSGSYSAPLLGDTWEWTGTAWREIALATAAPRPTARWGHAMVYDSVGGRTILCGGRDTAYQIDIWEWDGAAWVLVPPTGAAPPARYYHALAFDEARGRVVLFGGQNAGGLLDDTWEWDGTSWFAIPPAVDRPAARIHHAMAYDSDRSVVVLFGGEAGSALDDTWEWNGASWARSTPSNGSPSARGRHAMAYDTARQRTVLYGGRSGGAFGSLYRSDTWEWDGARWSLRSAAGNATLRHGHAMVYAAGQGQILCFGGQTGYFGQTNDTYLLPSGIDDQPAATLSVASSAAFVEPGAVLGSVEVAGFAGGVGNPAGVTTAGAELLLWDQDAWQPIAASSDDVQATGLLSWSSSDAALLARLRAAGAVHLAFRSAAPAGVQTAEVAVDYVELTVRYRLP